MLGEPSEGSDDYRMGVSRLAMTARTPSRVASTPVPQRDNHYVTIDMDGLGRQSPNTTFGREAQTQHEIDARMERMFTSMTDAFVTALSRVATPPAVHQRSLPLPEFRGMEHESAQDFLYRMEDHFHKLHVTDTSIKLALSCEQLKDQAKVWYEPYRYLITTYEAFAERLYERYDAVENLTQATTKLYGERQKPGESAAVFITRKMCLFNRVAREQPEEMRDSHCAGLARTRTLLQNTVPPVQVTGAPGNLGIQGRGGHQARVATPRRKKYGTPTNRQSVSP